ncbi:class I SAM-dependent methyltransferase [Echinicola strongylocentroti]|uniref:Class I SAM-dependent methyltransferase n=1 Tax=Echinicola strongylocentroti TaxID=1795355 RepID=A0A2Z4IL14_9BACT|nr:class I SAM-dependent methyltransferase [Echinicola strongylocentroti]AWW31792.1 class I SAM-dependent methyltransferase [Echinicola strongylocentroti]
MFYRIYPFFAYLRYFLLKVDRHSLQGPFAFQIYDTLMDFTKQKRDPTLEKKRHRLLSNDSSITVQDFGSGSIHLKHPVRKISAITKHSSSQPKFSLLYQYFCSISPAYMVLELGTCVGMTTCYLAKVTKGTVYTFEGAPELAQVAKNTFSDFPNVTLLPGHLSSTLPSFLEQRPTVNFALIDAHHNYPATLAFWNTLLPHLKEDSIVIIGDIHRSIEMEKAWEAIKSHVAVTMSMDFFECGVVFFKKGLKKQHYILHY